MADKKISIIVQAVVDAARRNLQGLNKDLNNLGDTSGTIAQRLKAQGETAKDAGLVLEKFGFTADEVNKHLKEAGYELESTASSFDVMGTGAKFAKEALIAIAAAFVALKLGQKAMELIRTAAAGDALRESFDKLAGRAYVDTQLLLSSLKEASRGTISEYDLMREANEAWYLGIAQNTKQYVDLMKIAEVKSKDLGISTLEYWQRLNTALASGYPIGLRNLGIVIDNEIAYRDWGATIGVAADELTDQQQIQARVNATIADGATALEDWDTTGESATTTAQQFDAATADMGATFKEDLLPAIIPVIRALTTMPVIFDQIGYIGGAALAGLGGAFGELYRLIEQRDWAALLSGQLGEAFDAAARMYGQQDAVAKGTMHTISTFTEMMQRKIGAVFASTRELLVDTTRGTEDLSDTVKKASDIYDKYVRDVEEANYRFGRSVADASFRAIQAAENAAFRRYEIERNAAQRYEDDLGKHTRTIRRQWQDLHDALSDIEWDYQEDRKDLLKRAPWWIQQALQKEFAERKRVAASGDAKALEAYDKALRERIRAIDPVYAEELDELQEQYDRKETVEQREARQARRRTRDDFREQERITRRELGDQLEAWRFHAGQRGENERRAMDNLIADNEHRLQTLYDNTNRRLAELDMIWKHYGHAHGVSYINQLQHILSSYTPMLPTPGGGVPYTPIPPGYTFPETNPWAAGAPVSLAGGEGAGAVTVSIGNLVVPASFTPQQGRQFARDVTEALGPEIRKRSR